MENMKIKNLMAAYKNANEYLPQEILDLVCGDKKYDQKYTSFLNMLNLTEKAMEKTNSELISFQPISLK